MRVVIVVFLFAILPLSSLAQQKVGTGKVEGRIVDLFDDGTWRAVETSQASQPVCAAADLFESRLIPLKVCFTSKDWTQVDTSDDFEVKFISTDQRLWAGIITERIPIGPRALKRGILERATAADGDELESISESAVEVFATGTSLNVINFTKPIADTRWRVSNAYGSIDQQGAFQIMFWTVESVFDATAKVRDRTLSSVKIAP